MNASYTVYTTLIHTDAGMKRPSMKEKTGDICTIISPLATESDIIQASAHENTINPETASYTAMSVPL